MLYLIKDFTLGFFTRQVFLTLDFIVVGEQSLVLSISAIICGGDHTTCWALTLSLIVPRALDMNSKERGSSSFIVGYVRALHQTVIPQSPGL